MMTVPFFQRLRQALLVCAVAIAAPYGFCESKTLAPQEYDGDIAKKMALMLKVEHVRQLNFDDSISLKAWENLIMLFDPNRFYFLQSDLKSFEDMQLKIDDAIQSGDVSFAYRVHRLFCTRLEERYVFTTNLLAQGFSFTNTEKMHGYSWEHKVAWPATLEEQNDLWYKRIRFDYHMHILAKELDVMNASNKLAQTQNATNSVAVTTNAVAKTSTTNVQAFKPEEIIAKRHKQHMLIVQNMDKEAVRQCYLSALCTAYDSHYPAIDRDLTPCGIGAELQYEDGMAKITALTPGGPAERDKRDIRLMKYDKIIGVAQGDGPIENIVYWPLKRTISKLIGTKGTKVVLKVIPAADPNGTTTKLVDLICDNITDTEKYPKSDLIKANIKVYKDFESGVSLQWAVKKMEKDGIYYRRDGNPLTFFGTILSFKDGNNDVSLAFASEFDFTTVDAKGVLAAARIVLPSGISHETAVKKYKDQYPGAVIKHEAKTETVDSQPTMLKNGMILMPEFEHIITTDHIFYENVKVDISSQVGVGKIYYAENIESPKSLLLELLPDGSYKGGVNLSYDLEQLLPLLKGQLTAHSKNVTILLTDVAVEKIFSEVKNNALVNARKKEDEEKRKRDADALNF